MSKINYTERIGENIKLLRGYHNVSREELAEAAKLAPSYIAALENPNQSKSPSISALERIATALKTTPGKILDSEPPNTRKYIEENLLINY
jgi:transcriptional regulator with XRE-family HTH domain